METPRFTHARINVTDLQRSIDWYERVLGVTAHGHYPQETPTYVHFNLGPGQLALGRYEPAPASGARFNLEVDDVDAWWDRIAHEGQVLEPLFDTPYGTRKFTILDPDGNELGFVQG